MWLYRRLLRISWNDHVTNEEVMRRTNTKKEVPITIKSRIYYKKPDRLQLLEQILQGKILGQRRTKKNFMAVKPKPVVCNDRR